MKMYDGFRQSMKNDEIFGPKIKYTGKLNENQKAMDIVPGFPINKKVKYDRNLMIKAVQNGMVILITYRGTTGKSKDKWRGGRERIIQPMNIGINKNTKNELIRAWHVDGYSVSQKSNVEKVWRLFNAENVKSMMFTGMFFRLPAKGYKMNDRVMTEKTIARADFNQIRRNQEKLIQAGKIESEEKTTINKPDSSVVNKIEILNTGTMLDLQDPWDNEYIKEMKKHPETVKISIMKTVFSNKFFAIVGALGEKNKTVKIYEAQKGNLQSKLLGSYKTIESFTGAEFKKFKKVNNMSEFDLFKFEKKI